MIDFVLNGGLLIHDDTTRHVVESAICLVPLAVWILFGRKGVKQ